MIYNQFLQSFSVYFYFLICCYGKCVLSNQLQKWILEIRKSLYDQKTQIYIAWPEIPTGFCVYGGLNKMSRTIKKWNPSTFHEIHCSRRVSGVTRASPKLRGAILRIPSWFRGNTATSKPKSVRLCATKDGRGASREDFPSNEIDRNEFLELARIQLAATGSRFVFFRFQRR